MSETITEHEAVEAAVVESDAETVSDEQLIAMLVDRARSDGLQLAGEGGPLQQLTKRVLESALEGEITDHVGYDKHDVVGRNSGNSRNGTRSKTVLTDVGPVEVKVPRDTAGTFEPQLVKKRQRRLTGVDEMVLSLSAKGLTHGEISAHLAEAYGAEVSRQTITTITHKVMEGMAEWQAPSARSRLPRRLRGRHQREDSRWQGRQPAHLRGHGCHRRGHPRHPRDLGR
jgi:putative transposase